MREIEKRRRISSKIEFISLHAIADNWRGRRFLRSSRCLFTLHGRVRRHTRSDTKAEHMHHMERQQNQDLRRRLIFTWVGVLAYNGARHLRWLFQYHFTSLSVRFETAVPTCTRNLHAERAIYARECWWTSENVHNEEGNSNTSANDRITSSRVRLRCEDNVGPNSHYNRMGFASK